MQDEETLVRRAQQRDEAAFAQLYEANFDKIYRYVVIRLGDRVEAEDVTQQVFLNAFQSVTTFRWQGTSFAAWLFRIAHNKVIDLVRKRAKQTITPLDDDLPVVGPDADDPRLMTERKLDVEQVLQAMSRLTPAQHEVIALRFTSGLPVAQVAQIMSKSPGAIKSLQHSAIVALRKALLVVADNEPR